MKPEFFKRQRVFIITAQPPVRKLFFHTDLIQKLITSIWTIFFTLVEVHFFLFYRMNFSSDKRLLYAFVIFPENAFTLIKLVSEEISLSLTFLFLDLGLQDGFVLICTWGKENIMIVIKNEVFTFTSVYILYKFRSNSAIRDTGFKCQFPCAAFLHFFLQFHQNISF